jgi:hypothetical protein
MAFSAGDHSVKVILGGKESQKGNVTHWNSRDDSVANLGHLLAHAALSALFRAKPAIFAILASVARIGSRAGRAETIWQNFVLHDDCERYCERDSENSTAEHERYVPPPVSGVG